MSMMIPTLRVVLIKFHQKNVFGWKIRGMNSIIRGVMSEKHDKDCQLGDNWKWCKCCVEQWNETCSPKEIMKIPVGKSPNGLIIRYK